MDGSDDLGVFERHGDHIDARFERHYPRPAETVWSALTEPGRLADWMGAARVEPFAGGRIELMLDGVHSMSGQIRIWEPPHVLEFSWNNTHAPHSVVRYELTRDGSGTRLVFTHKGIPYVNSALMLPGWHDFLARLATLVHGVTPASGTAGWSRMQATYVDRYQLDGVRLTP